MPVSFWPVLVPILLIITPLALWKFFNEKIALVALAFECIVVVLFFLSVYVPGWRLMAKAEGGDPRAQYELARWHSNHDRKIGEVFLWPGKPNATVVYAWLEKSAAQNYPPALYVLGVLLKGEVGYEGPQPERGRKLIDEALKRGFCPQSENFYVSEFLND
jgi:hypothetical protein